MAKRAKEKVVYSKEAPDFWICKDKQRDATYGKPSSDRGEVETTMRMIENVFSMRGELEVVRCLPLSMKPKKKEAKRGR